MQKTASEFRLSLVGSELCLWDRDKVGRKRQFKSAAHCHAVHSGNDRVIPVSHTPMKLPTTLLVVLVVVCGPFKQ